MGGCSTLFVDPKFYFCLFYKKTNGAKNIYNQKLYDEITQNQLAFIRNEKKLSNGYIAKYYNDSFKFFNIRLFKSSFYYEDSLDIKHIIYDYSGCIYTEYGLWITGDEASGVRLHFTK